VGLLDVHIFDGGTFSIRHGARANFGLNNLHDRGRSGAAKFPLELHTIPIPGIMTGRDDHAASSTTALDRV
jgi:hypothetical protein